MNEEHTNTTENDILEVVLNKAFSPPPPLRRESLSLAERSTVQGIVSESPASETATESVASTSDDQWKVEYEAQVASWRAQSAEARAKAEEERQRWEAIRKAEEKEAIHQKPTVTADLSAPSEEREAGWETVARKESLATPESHPSSPEAPNDLISGGSNSQFAPTLAHIGLSTSVEKTALTPNLRQDGDDSSKWDDIQSSITSSLPSMSYPERTETPSPSRQRRDNSSPPVSATLAIFDSSLSTRTRVTAFFSSLAINMLLPFVNGVMLGFGEMFAKNFVLSRLGWGSKSMATSVGIGLSSTRQRRSG